MFEAWQYQLFAAENTSFFFLAERSTGMQESSSSIYPASPSHILAFLSCPSSHTFVKSLFLLMDQLQKLITECFQYQVAIP